MCKYTVNVAFLICTMALVIIGILLVVCLIIYPIRGCHNYAVSAGIIQLGESNLV